MSGRDVILTAMVLVFATAGFYGLDGWLAQLTEGDAFRAFVLSPQFGRVVFAVLFLLISIAAFSCAALVFHPARLSGRTPERGE